MILVGYFFRFFVLWFNWMRAELAGRVNNSHTHAHNNEKLMNFNVNFIATVVVVSIRVLRVWRQNQTCILDLTWLDSTRPIYLHIFTSIIEFFVLALASFTAAFNRWNENIQLNPPLRVFELGSLESFGSACCWAFVYRQSSKYSNLNWEYNFKHRVLFFHSFNFRSNRWIYIVVIHIFKAKIENGIHTHSI